jgi:hypothetical protein
MTSQGHLSAQFRKAVQRRDLADVEAILGAQAFVPLSAARELVELYAEAGSPKYEKAALKYLLRYMTEADPPLADVAQVAALLAERALLMRGT